MASSASSVHTLKHQLAHLQSQVEQQLAALALRIDRLQIDEEQFVDWFDAQLFRADATCPADYLAEVRLHLHALVQQRQPQRTEWLSARIADQLQALHQAVAWFERK
ncbi:MULTISPECIES: primosomal replication protein PriC [Idiomarinaceae]|uniref:Primosomal replication protein PriC n=4 Tax=Pseudidiomarina TaxID=2800384 RepID=A0A368V4F7_9GAMM|nr:MULTISPECIES: primosomal replication protein PriC [Idiomarinaceae]MDT7525577.1 primosomal replication protein [Pseudidiomarina sp. GXY010]PWW15978.1 primosomal replication protein PriC [Pseudidiomarina maritima]RBP93512.1 primosomal replication protein PriC [Pseudidiomarina tainanensis]RCW35972.1 primosomal replication protein PriC [Pseudidiomarina tainanensis]UUN14837.1 primosomal replication protein [Idiomarina loihiensis]